MHLATDNSSTGPPRPGVITKLEAQKRNPDRVSVFLDGDFAFGVHQKTLLDFGLYKGLHLDIETQQQIKQADRERAARIIALDYLSYKARSEYEVLQKLRQKGIEEDIAEQTLAYLRERGYIDDPAYARSFATSRFKNKGYGPRRITSDLMQRGIARAHIDSALAVLTADEDILATALRYGEKRWQRLARESDPTKRRKKLSDYLLRRGYPYDVVRQILEILTQRDE